MSARTDGVMLINPDVDGADVLALQAIVVDAVEAWHDKTGKPRVAALALESLLCNVCDVIQGAPDEATRAAMTSRAFEFIMRNCGVEPTVVWERHMLTKHGVGAMEPEGSA